jgi:hypothetical protein
VPLPRAGRLQPPGIIEQDIKSLVGLISELLPVLRLAPLLPLRLLPPLHPEILARFIILLVSLIRPPSELAVRPLRPAAVRRLRRQPIVEEVPRPLVRRFLPFRHALGFHTLAALVSKQLC